MGHDHALIGKVFLGYLKSPARMEERTLAFAALEIGRASVVSDAADSDCADFSVLVKESACSCAVDLARLVEARLLAESAASLLEGRLDAVRPLRVCFLTAYVTG